jgi:hypothetical protein
VKKFLAIFLGVVFVLGFAASAFAIHAEIPAETQAVVAKGATQINIGGDLLFRGEFNNNTTDFNSDFSDHNELYDGRVRLSVNAQVTPNTQGMVMIEAADSNVDTAYTWGQDATGAFGLYSAGNAKQAQLNLLEAWILHTGSGLLGVPAGIKVGHMPLALGNNLFFDHSRFGDDAVLVFVQPLKELELAALTAKFREGATNLNDDATTYVGLFAYNTKEFGLSGDVTYVDDQQSFGTAGGALVPFGATATHFWNFGLRGNVNVGGLGIKADGELQSGKIDGIDVKFRGYAILAGLSYDVSGVKLGLDWAYGSGDNSADAKLKSFVTSLSDTEHYTLVYEYRTPNACGQQHGGICNTMYLKGSLAADLMKDLSGNLDLYWLHANKKWFGPGEGFGAPTSSSDIGVELDGKVNYKIDRNLNYFVEGGYLFAGDYWKDLVGKNPDDAFMVRHGIELSF